MKPHRKVIVHIATSADGYIARPDGDIDWLTARPAPKGFYGMEAFMKSIDTTVMGRKTYETSLQMGATFGGKDRTIVFSRQAQPANAPKAVEFRRRLGPVALRREWVIAGAERTESLAGPGRRS